MSLGILSRAIINKCCRACVPQYAFNKYVTFISGWGISHTIDCIYEGDFFSISIDEILKVCLFLLHVCVSIGMTIDRIYPSILCWTMHCPKHCMLILVKDDVFGTKVKAIGILNNAMNNFSSLRGAPWKISIPYSSLVIITWKILLTLKYL